MSVQSGSCPSLYRDPYAPWFSNLFLQLSVSPLSAALSPDVAECPDVFSLPTSPLLLHGPRGVSCHSLLLPFHREGTRGPELAAASGLDPGGSGLFFRHHSPLRDMTQISSWEADLCKCRLSNAHGGREEAVLAGGGIVSGPSFSLGSACPILFSPSGPPTLDPCPASSWASLPPVPTLQMSSTQESFQERRDFCFNVSPARLPVLALLISRRGHTVPLDLSRFPFHH